MAPIIKLLKSEGKLEWNDKCQEAFEEVKRILTSAPILTMPNTEDPYILAVDFSYEGMGLVLSQIQDGQERVIGYYSKSLSEAERKYAATEGECAAVLWAVNKVR